MLISSKTQSGLSVCSFKRLHSGQNPAVMRSGSQSQVGFSSSRRCSVLYTEVRKVCFSVELLYEHKAETGLPESAGNKLKISRLL